MKSEATPTVLVPLADGFEEIEAVAIVDVLRRAGAAVTTASLNPTHTVRGAHDISVLADSLLQDIRGEDYSMMVLPGGMPGAQKLRDSQKVQDLLRDLGSREKWTAAICAAPMALGPAGLVAGRHVTCYPGFEDRFEHGPHHAERVVVDGKVITSRGPGTALEFALVLVEKLFGPEKAQSLRTGMIVAPTESVFEA